MTQNRLRLRSVTAMVLGFVMCGVLAVPNLVGNDVAMTVGCPKPTVVPMRLSVSALSNRIHPRRIVLVTTDEQSSRMREQRTFADFLARYLNANSAMSVVVCPQTVCQKCLPMRKGTFDERELLEFGKRFNADAVMYLEITNVDVIPTMSINVSAALISVSESVALVSVDDTVTLGDRATKHAFCHFGCLATPHLEADIRSQSPSLMLEFAANSLSKELSLIWPR